MTAKSLTPQAAVDHFNGQHQVGTPVRYWPGARLGEGRESKTRTPAWLVGGHTACVSVEGHPGGIALTHVDVMPAGHTATLTSTHAARQGDPGED